MIVCLCNAIRDSQIQAEICSGVTRPREVFERLGCNPVCGKCVPHMRECMRGTLETTTISENDSK